MPRTIITHSKTHLYVLLFNRKFAPDPVTEKHGKAVGALKP